MKRDHCFSLKSCYKNMKSFLVFEHQFGYEVVGLEKNSFGCSIALPCAVWVIGSQDICIFGFCFSGTSYWTLLIVLNKPWNTALLSIGLLHNQWFFIEKGGGIRWQLYWFLNATKNWLNSQQKLFCWVGATPTVLSHWEIIFTAILSHPDTSPYS